MFKGYQLVQDVVAVVDHAIVASTSDLRKAVAARANGAPDAPRLEQANTVLAMFHADAGPRSMSQGMSDWPLRQGVPISFLCGEDGGDGWPLGASRVTFCKNDERFDFADEGDAAAVSAIVVVLPDREGYAIDLAAWAPRSNQLGNYLGRAAIGGEHMLYAPRFGEAMQLKKTFLA